jgi:hypothetical protein
LRGLACLYQLFTASFPFLRVRLGSEIIALLFFLAGQCSHIAYRTILTKILYKLQNQGEDLRICQPDELLCA